MKEFCGYPLFAEGTSVPTALAALADCELGDGLPVVPPTARLLEQMLDAVDDSERVLGLVPPLFGQLSAAIAAYQCVLAGCVPAHLPLIVTAVEATLAADFNLLGVATTTGTPAVAMIVHGPIAQALNVRGGGNCLGPGVGSNASLGRALSFVLRNVGGSHAGVGDMATMGQPGKYTFCFAESDAGTISSLAVRRGLDAHCDAVTLMAVSGTAEVLPIEGGATVAQLLDPVALAMGAAIAQSGARTRDPQGQMMLVPPEILRSLAKVGFGLEQIQNYLFENAAIPTLSGELDEARKIARAPNSIDIVETGGPGVKMTYTPLWSGGTEPQTVAVRYSL